jgi:hypothetical protein
MVVCEGEFASYLAKKYVYLLALEGFSTLAR